ncbi:hypothetical protein [Sphingobacterium multivorum]|uniref:Uncharacterized protein n=1 Tax=Sphingobacterium multivorum TaxID=28454 RepID=A0A2X2JJ23_SPHMU|nr:hypothetical protein [Sphingobacterium multivorum]QRQ59997.1 hypothetical protein I6J33_17805 [Sphingobacterium multivorum]SPZ92136.1 Uncharacterised protein [Sphingobacterium multivorum]
MNADNLDQDVIRFFEPFFERSPTGFEFSYKYLSDQQKEIWVNNGYVNEVASGIWKAYHQIPISVTNLFIASSCTDILCFAHLFQQYVDNALSIAFASIGYLPSRENFRELICEFPNAKIHLIAENSLIGKIFDCKIALWSRSIDSKFRVNNELIEIKFGSQSLVLPIEKFSLNYFEVISGKRFAVRTHKPVKGFLNFHKLFTAL